MANGFCRDLLEIIIEASAVAAAATALAISEAAAIAAIAKAANRKSMIEI